MKTTFVKKPFTLSNVLSGRDQIRSWYSGQDMTPCYIAAEKHLSASEWSDFTEDLLTEREWIADFSTQEYEDEGEAVACLRVTGDGSEIALLIDPSGYSYARYVGVEGVSESTAELPPDVNPKQTAAPAREGNSMTTIVIKVWRGLVSEIYASNPNTHITIVDEDAGDELPPSMPEHRVY